MSLNLIADPAARVVSAHAHRAKDPNLLGHFVAATLEPPVQAFRHHREQGDVDRAAESFLQGLVAALQPTTSALWPDLAVEEEVGSRRDGRLVGKPSLP